MKRTRKKPESGLRRNIKTMEERFWAKVNKDGPTPSGHESYARLGACWLYGGTVTICYPRAHLRRAQGLPQKIAVSRYSYQLHHGDIDDSMVVRHKCDNGHLRCVNPEHLEPGTQADNVRDMYRRNKVSGVMTRAKIDALRRIYEAGAIQEDIAILLGARQPQVARWLSTEFLATDREPQRKGCE